MQDNCKPSRQSQIGSAVSELSRQLERLEEVCKSHADRITPILRPNAEVVGGCCGQSVPKEVTAPLAEALTCAADKVASACAFIEVLNSRVEI